MTETDPALLIAQHYERGKAETAAAFHHFRDPVDVDKLIEKFAVAIIPVLRLAVSFPSSRHANSPFSSIIL
jgi:hypothetical protein